MFTFADAWPAMALMAVVLSLPWLASWLKRRGWAGSANGAEPLRVVSLLAVGSQQKVVTVEVNLGTHRKWLILGVTAQSVTKLDSLDILERIKTGDTDDSNQL